MQNDKKWFGNRKTENHLVTDGLYVFEQHRKQNKRSEIEIWNLSSMEH